MSGEKESSGKKKKCYGAVIERRKTGRCVF